MRQERREAGQDATPDLVFEGDERHAPGDEKSGANTTPTGHAEMKNAIRSRRRPGRPLYALDQLTITIPLGFCRTGYVVPEKYISTGQGSTDNLSAPLKESGPLGVVVAATRSLAQKRRRYKTPPLLETDHGGDAVRTKHDLDQPPQRARRERSRIQITKSGWWLAILFFSPSIGLEAQGKGLCEDGGGVMF
jgi:hypothetical protein